MADNWTKEMESYNKISGNIKNIMGDLGTIFSLIKSIAEWSKKQELSKPIEEFEEAVEKAKQNLANLDAKFIQKIENAGYGAWGRQVAQDGFDTSSLRQLLPTSDERNDLSNLVTVYKDERQGALGVVDRTEADLERAKNFQQQQKEMQEIADAMQNLPKTLEQLLELAKESKGLLNGIDTQVKANNDLLQTISTDKSEEGTPPKSNTTPPPATQSALLDAQAFAPTIGQAHDGIDSVPREGTWLLDKGERVIDARTNQDLKNFLAKDDDKKEIVDLVFKNNALLQQTYELLVQRLADERATPTLTSPTTGEAMPVEFAELAAQGSTQQLRDFETAAINAEQAITSFLSNMGGMNEDLQGLEDILKNTLNTESIFSAIYEGEGLDSLLAGLHEQLNAYAIQKSSHLLMESAYETVLGTAALLNPMTAGNSAGHFAAAAKYASGAVLMGTFAKLSGMAHDGMDNIPQEGSWLLEKGERVVDSRTNQDLKNFLSKGSSSINVNVSINGGDKESIMKALPELEKVIVSAVAGNIIQGGQIKRTIMDYTR